MNVQLRAVEIQRRHPMADWPGVVANEPLEFRAAIEDELKIACDRMRAARLARRTDPSTSHEAAVRVTMSGSRADHVGRIVKAVHARPGRTSAELARLTGLERHEAARRTSDAEHQGLIRKGPARPCSVSGKAAVTWHPIADGAVGRRLQEAA